MPKATRVGAKRQPEFGPVGTWPPTCFHGNLKTLSVLNREVEATILAFANFLNFATIR